MSSTPLPPTLPVSLPISRITIPSTPLITSALAYTCAHVSPSTLNHCLRSTAFALAISKKHPALATRPIDPETLVLSVLMHDLGWSATAELQSPDKRFEVDGADAARRFLHTQAKTEGSSSSSSSSVVLDEQRASTLWTAIALHTTPSVSLHHPAAEVAATALGIMADFAGPNLPGGLLGVDEYKEVVRAFPRLRFADELKGIMCGLCRNKPETTYDNFVGEFGLRFLEGSEKEKFQKGLKGADVVEMLMGGLQRCREFE